MRFSTSQYHSCADVVPHSWRVISRRKLYTKVSLVAAVSLICLRSLSEEHLDQKLLPKTFATRHETQHVEWIQDMAWPQKLLDRHVRRRIWHVILPLLFIVGLRWHELWLCVRLWLQTVAWFMLLVWACSLDLHGFKWLLTSCTMGLGHSSHLHSDKVRRYEQWRKHIQSVVSSRRETPLHCGLATVKNKALDQKLHWFMCMPCQFFEGVHITKGPTVSLSQTSAFHEVLAVLALSLFQEVYTFGTPGSSTLGSQGTLFHFARMSSRWTGLRGMQSSNFSNENIQAGLCKRNMTKHIHAVWSTTSQSFRCNGPCLLLMSMSRWFARCLGRAHWAMWHARMVVLEAYVYTWGQSLHFGTGFLNIVIWYRIRKI